jgi:exonuclease SbcD
MALKILQTSDIHLGAKLTYLGQKAVTHRHQIIDTFEKICNHALQNNYDMLLIAGDLFDSPFPSRNNITLVMEQISKLTEAGIYVVLIPGNHDRLVEGSVYTKQELGNYQSDFFKLFKKENAEQWFISKLDVTIHGSAVTSQKDKNTHLTSYVKNRIE